MRDLAWRALADVRDPELDQPITDLGFVAALDAGDDGIRVELRLPTYFCAPNFAWLMVADARDALAAIPGAGPVTVTLVDHFAASEINSAAAFADHFQTDGQDGDLAELRSAFDRKAHTAAQERLARQLMPLAGDRLGGLTLAEASRLAPDAAAAVARRRERLGLVSDHAICDDRGAPIAAEDLGGWLRSARTVRVSVDGNAELCRGLLATRYGVSRS
ncbi:iron-sulfur cluster assembly protein [Actinoplanes sp. NPDC023714]|uniref:iron-sulfur cluster assembly protein n=1 Tax=Actinoplanes sp. NPDC023714 TaxID=3154322 RepID=UPI0033D3DE51